MGFTTRQDSCNTQHARQRLYMCLICGNPFPNKEKTGKKCRLLATAGRCTHPPRAHISMCIDACSYADVCVCGNVPEKCTRVCFISTMVSCLMFLEVIMVKHVPRPFQDSAEAIPLMVESCIRFISRHGESSSPVK